MLGVDKTYGLLSKTIGFKFSFVYHLSFVIEERFFEPAFYLYTIGHFIFLSKITPTFNFLCKNSKNRENIRNNRDFHIQLIKLFLIFAAYNLKMYCL